MARALTQDMALDSLRYTITDSRQRALYPADGMMWIADDMSATSITAFDDVTAVHFFLEWLDGQREASAKERETQAKRSKFKLMQGGAV